MWDDPGNAAAYDAFARRYGMYDQTSAGLVEAAGFDPDAAVVDLCCGTGRTTLAVLAALGPLGRVVGVDEATAMLDLARRHVTDPRVTWSHRPAEELTLTTPADAVLCNSAVWQTDLPRTFAAVRRSVRPGGRFAFNVGRRFLGGADTFEPTLGLALRQIAAREFQWQAPTEPRPRQPRPSADDLQAMLSAAGFTPDPPVAVSYRQEADEQRAWLTIPIFTERLLPGLGYDQRMAVLSQAPAPPSLSSDWTIFTATAA